MNSVLANNNRSSHREGQSEKNKDKKTFISSKIELLDKSWFRISFLLLIASSMFILHTHHLISLANARITIKKRFGDEPKHKVKKGSPHDNKVQQEPQQKQTTK